MTRQTKKTTTTKTPKAKATVVKMKPAAPKAACPKCGHQHADRTTRVCRSVAACKARQKAVA